MIAHNDLTDEGYEMKVNESNTDLTDEECEMKVIENNNHGVTDEECEMKVNEGNTDLTDEGSEMKVIKHNDLTDEECEMKVNESNNDLTDEGCEMHVIKSNSDLADEECEMQVIENNNGVTDEECEMTVNEGNNDLTDEGCEMKLTENKDLGDERCEMKVINRPNKDLGDERCDMKEINRPNKDLGDERCEMKVSGSPNKERGMKELISEDDASVASTATCDDHTGCHDDIASFGSMPCTPERVLCSVVDLSLQSSMVVRNCGQSAVCDNRFIESVGLGSNLDHDAGTLPGVTMVMSDVSLDRCIGSNHSVDCGDVVGPHCLLNRRIGDTDLSVDREDVVGPHCPLNRRIGDTNLSIDHKDVLGPHCPFNIRRLGDTNLSVVALSDPKLPDSTCSGRIVRDGGIVAPPWPSNLHRDGSSCPSNLHCDGSSLAGHVPLPPQTIGCMNAKLPQYSLSSTVAFTECPHFTSCPFHSILYGSSLLTPVTPHTRPPDQPHAATEHGPAVLSALVDELRSPGDASSASLLPTEGVYYQRLYIPGPSECVYLQDSSDVFPYRSPSVRPTRHIMRG